MSHTVATMTTQRAQALEERLERVIALHFHPKEGSAYWLDRAAELGVAPGRQVRRIEDLELLGDMQPGDLCRRPLADYIPRRFHRELDRFVLGQTGGTTGGGTWTAYREDEFNEAFIAPFAVAARHVGFPGKEPWLYIGPSGPHIIGKVARHLAGVVGCADPFSVDFDARWAKRLPDGSFAGKRYLQHVLDQAMSVITHQDVGVLFTTPAILRHLSEMMNVEQRARIRGVHYGGMALAADELRRFQCESFPSAVHLSGYGNTLFGCCLELSTTVGRWPTYFPYGARLHLEVVDERAASSPGREPLVRESLLAPPGLKRAGQRGRVRFTRLDESMLIVRMLERDEASSVEPPSDAPDGFTLAGVGNPQPMVDSKLPVAHGLY